MAYRSSAERAEDNNSSGYMLIIVGIVGLIGDIFVFINNPFDMALFNKYMSCGVMGALFVLFFVMGILSIKSARIFKEKAKEENTLLEQITKWCDENLDADQIDHAIENPDEMISFDEEGLSEMDADVEDIAALDGVTPEEAEEYSRVEAYETDSYDDVVSEDQFDEFYGSEEFGEDKFFARTEYIKNRINKQYVNLNQELLDDFVEKYYEKLFGENN